MKRFLICVLCSVVLMSSSAFAENEIDYIYRLLQGFPDNAVPDENAALGVAEALIRGKHGEEALKQNQPLEVRRDGEFWVVESQNQKPVRLTSVRISQVDARVDSFKVFWHFDRPPFPQVQTKSKDDCHASCHMLQEKK